MKTAMIIVAYYFGTMAVIFLLSVLVSQIEYRRNHPPGWDEKP